ncbi:hypothetical protein EDC01DRAFT_688548 [Geopyxis carbonaria]|nr:hypothetical protein EDC01DRAFT_688548 [Geopyxis carbonaria]
MFSSDDNFGDDFGDDIDDADFVALATQAEQQTRSQSLPQQTQPLFIPNELYDLDELSDDFTPTVQVQARPAQQPFQTFRKGAPSTEGLRQSTLHGGRVEEEDGANTGNVAARRNWPLAGSQSQEKPTHHEIDREAAKTWIYPTNVSFRDYQFNIVKRALFSNVLCALPTGLGKTFIAATVMLNWFRWAPKGQIAFLAPTKPLVNQQIDACYYIAGIPRSQTAVMTGGVPKATRQEYWEERRVFFTTPQTMQNDIKNGICDPKRIVCLVVDEAHRATGAYAYVEVVKLLRRENTSFRLLALTATPGSTVEAVQGVIDSLGIVRVEIRTDESLDIRDYIQKRTVEIETFELPPDIMEVRDLYCKCLEPILKKLNQAKAFYQTNAERLTPFAVISAMQQWMMSPVGRQMQSNKGYYWSIINSFKNLSSLAHPLGLLNTHGLRLFHDKLLHAPMEDQEGVAASDKALNAIRKEQSFRDLMARCSDIVSDLQFSGHPKMDYMVGAVLRHFAEAEDEETKRSTRIMIFTSFRDSAEEITRFLKRHEPIIRPHVFVGQAAAKNTAGMSQKEQLEIVKQFQDGTYNTIVSTSIGEEGLDIGEVDLIVCYDMQASPIRLLQRMGRTGRKRNGGVLILVTEGREADSYKKALDNYQFMQKKIAAGTDFTFPHDLSPRIIPKEIESQPEKKNIEVPPENSQPEPAKKRRAPKKKAPPKKFFMPDDVPITGFLKASRLGKPHARSPEVESEPEKQESDYEEPEVVLTGSIESILLTPAQEKDLQRKYMSDFSLGGDSEVGLIEYPSLTSHPEHQRQLTKTNLVKHGKTCRHVVGMLQRMHSMDEDQITKFKGLYDVELLKSPKKPKTKPFKPVRPSFMRSCSPLLSSSGNVAEPTVKSKIPPMKSSDIRAARMGKPKPKPRKTAPKRIELSSDRSEDEVEEPVKPKPKPRKTAPKRIQLSSDESEEETVKPQRRTKRQKTVSEESDNDVAMDNVSDGSDDLPDVKDILSGFKWAGSKKTAR